MMLTCSKSSRLPCGSGCVWCVSHAAPYWDLLSPIACAALRCHLQVMNRDVIDRLPVLQLLPPEVVTKLLPRLTQSTYLPGEFVVEEAAHGTAMFLIRRGKVDVVLPKSNVVYLTLLPGDFFGEEVLVGAPTYNASYRAVDYLDLLLLEKVEYQELELYSRVSTAVCVMSPLAFHVVLAVQRFTRLISEVCGHRKELKIRAQLEVLRSPFKKGVYRGSVKRVRSIVVYGGL